MSMHYFSCWGGTGVDSTKALRDTVCRTCVLYPVESAGHVVHSGGSSI
jgi:hypothetical protein